jgi:hypothetical protein
LNESAMNSKKPTIEEKTNPGERIPGLQDFIRENSHLWWWIPEENKQRLSLDSIVEAVLNYGTEKSVRRLFELAGIRRVKQIFLRQISGKRPNYFKLTIHFFKLYFERHAPGDSDCHVTGDPVVINRDGDSGN